jgi:DNA-3-methyladenine glycosylase II
MTIYESSGKLFPNPPFDFSKSLNFTVMFTPTSDEQTISNLSLTKAVYIKNMTMAFKVEDIGTVDEPVLFYTLYAYDEISDEIKFELLERINFYLSLEDGLKDFYSLGRDDIEFNPILEDLYGLHQVKFLTPFEGAAWAVLSQRISMKVAHLMKDRLTKAVGDNIQVDKVDYWTFPDAHQVKNLGAEKLQSIIKNKRKSEYLIAVADAFNEVNENFLIKAPIDEVKNWLLNIKGIGEYSAHLELVRALGRMEELSAHHDKMLMICAKKIYGPHINEENLDKIADSYGKFKGYWSYYLRTAC